MDPALRELMEGSGGDEVEAVLRLEPGGVPPPGVRIVSRFGDVATCRLRRSRIAEAWADDDVASLKAPRPFGVDPDPMPAQAGGAEGEGAEESLEEDDVRRPAGLAETGRGVLAGVIDWGFDFAHPNFRNADGSTRALALWDQSAPGPAPAPYGYGRVYTREEIDRALATDNPYETLGYHPASGDPGGRGAHGTHVLDIAAGNGRAAGSPAGIAPEADLVFVHLASRGTSGEANLGDSVTLLEALDWIARLAGDRPWVVNLSMGTHGGPHLGRTLVEQGIDALLLEAPGRAVVQSTGNYFSAQVHAEGCIRPGQERTLRWWTDQADLTPNELEVWYPGGDVFAVEICPPDEGPAVRVPLGGQASIVAGGREVGRAYHRAKDPNSGDNHLDIFLGRAAPAGRWEVTLTGEDVVDGRYHAWVERDAGCPSCQSRFDPEDAVETTTTGTICNGFRSLVVGAYDQRSPGREPARFSSSGPTRDGRIKPDLLAPGVRVLAARSASFEQGEETPALTRMSGTSMAAPHVTGTVALLFEAAGRPLRIQETRRLLLSAAEPAPPEMAQRAGSGYLDIERAVAAARELGHPAGRAEAQTEAREEPVAKPRDCGCGCGGPGRAATAPPEELPDWEDDEETDMWDEEGEDGPEGWEEEEKEEEEEDDDDESWVDEEEEDDEEDEEGLRIEIIPDLDGRPVAPAALFDAFVVPRAAAVRRHLERWVEVIALPGGQPEAVRQGDLLLRRALGEGGLGHAAPIGETVLPDRLPQDQMVLRLRSGSGLGEGLQAFHGDLAETPAQICRVVQKAKGKGKGKGKGGKKTPPPPLPTKVTVLVRSRFIKEAIAGCDVVLAGNGFRVQGTTDSAGKVSLTVTGAPDGDYQMTFTPASNTAAVVGPAIAAATPRPDRIWRVLAAPVTLKSQKAANGSTSVANGTLSASKGTVTARIQPVWMQSPNRSARPKDTAVTLCVVHHTGGTTEQTALNTFLNKKAVVSAHYLVGLDGQPIKLVDESEESNHAGPSHWGGADSVNGFSVGIEIVHQSGAYPKAQINGVRDLINRIRAAQTGITAGRIVGHSDIATNCSTDPCSKGTPRQLGRKAGDPGTSFEWDTLRTAGLGIPISSTAPPAGIYGGVFALDPALRLRSGDNDRRHVYGGRQRATITANVIRELQTDLAAIGYFCPVTGTFGQPTVQAVNIFQEHFFSGGMTRAAHRGQVDLATAEMIKLVRP